MNQDQVKERLLALRPGVPDFTVIFSGKASKKVNGLYKPESREIIIHNKNFDSDNLLMYTALHEFAHHIHFSSDHPPSGMRAHTKEFHCLLSVLVREAIGQGLYEDTVADEELATLTAEIKKEYLEKMAALEKEMGQKLMEAEQLCRRKGVRYEEYLDRGLGMSRAHAQQAMRVAALDVPEDIGIDGMRAVASHKSQAEREEMVAALQQGVPLVEAQASPSSASRDKKNPEKALVHEQRRIRKTIASLTARMEEIARLLGEHEKEREPGGSGGDEALLVADAESTP